MIRRELTVVNRLGLHARAAAKLVGTASRFTSDIQLERNGQRVNGKSIMGVMMLAASQGSEIALLIDGADEDAALAALESLITDRFGESE
jgi:phosphocarrier protein HPr